MSLIPNIQEIKARMKGAWNAGDYGVFAKYMEPGAIEILNSWNLRKGDTFLDVACGSGQISIPASRAGLDVTGVDIATNSIEFAKTRASYEGLNAVFEEGDAESLRFENDTFDVVATIVGAMFAPQPEKVSLELLRVCKPGGRIRMVNWTPTGMVGEMFKAIGKVVPSPSNVAPPVLWGVEEMVEYRLGHGCSKLNLTRKIYPLWNYPFEVPEVVEFFLNYYGPTQKAYQSLDKHGQDELRAGLEDVFSKHNTGDNGTTTFISEYLEVDAVKK